MISIDGTQTLGDLIIKPPRSRPRLHVRILRRYFPKGLVRGLVTFTSFDAPDVTDMVMSLMTSGWCLCKRLMQQSLCSIYRALSDELEAAMDNLSELYL